MWRPAACGALAVTVQNLVLVWALSLFSPLSLRLRYFPRASQYDISPPHVDQTFKVDKASPKPGSTWIFLATCLSIEEQFTAVAKNDSDNTVGVRQGGWKSQRVQRRGGGRGRGSGAAVAVGLGSKNSMYSHSEYISLYTVRGSSICNAKTLEPDRALGQWEKVRGSGGRQSTGKPVEYMFPKCARLLYPYTYF
ncbi:hypothetical protein R3P38DRAFT_2798732 [Favolaschia claudopus]|uniref:Uncharacterized protein n=1 Tax=Favolaschia claudopus TaxID=2862362 RepID=A0AAV9Z4D6_9AGAR